PYDLTDWGFDPIAIETPEGKAEYVRSQRDFADRPQILRRRLIDSINLICHESCSLQPVTVFSCPDLVRGPGSEEVSYPRTISAPALRALILPLATGRDKGAMPQLVDGQSLSASTNWRAFRSVLATSCGVSTVSVATSMARTITFLPRMSSMRSIGTREF